MSKHNALLINKKINIVQLLGFLISNIFISLFIMYVYDYNFTYITLMFTILMPVMIVYFFLSKDIMHPFNIFFMSSQFLFVFNMIDLNANKGYFRYGQLPSNYYDTTFAYAILVIFVWYFAMFLGFNISKKVKWKTFKNTSPTQLKKPILIATILFIFSLLSFTYILTAKGGISGMIVALTTGRTSAYSGMAYMIYLTSLATIASLIFLCERHKKLSLVIIIVSFLMLSLYGGRYTAFFGSIFPYLVCYHYTIKRLKVSTIGIVAILGVAFGIAFGNYRLYQEISINFTNIYDIISKMAHSSQGGEILPSLVGSLLKGNMDYMRGSTLINIIYAPIPRSIWINKPPIDETGIVGRALMGSEGWGLPPGPYGIAFLNFSFMGVIIFGFFTGVLVNRIYTKVILSNKYRKNNYLGVVFYALAMPYIFNVISTSAQINILWYFGVLLIVIFIDKLFNKFSYK